MIPQVVRCEAVRLRHLEACRPYYYTHLTEVVNVACDAIAETTELEWFSENVHGHQDQDPYASCIATVDIDKAVYRHYLFRGLGMLLMGSLALVCIVCLCTRKRR